MFGLLTDTPDEEVGWGRLGGARRFAGRRFGDVDWGAVVTAGINLTTGIVNAATKSQGQPACPPGYVYNPNTRMCDAIYQQPQPGAGGSFLSNIDPMVLLVGGGLLVLVLATSGKS